ncbi:hypothetical protein HZ994_11660 [Akkermansiaceae bacterium]|nr:hypothetical protein HZ994_11660 [Akkermansiaceae bacterium]
MTPSDQTERPAGLPEHSFFGPLPFAIKMFVAWYGPEILHPHGLEVMLDEKGIQKMESNPEGRFVLGALRRKQREQGYGPTESVRLALQRYGGPGTDVKFETHCRILVLYQEALRNQGRFPTVPELIQAGANKGPAQSESGITRIVDETLILPRVNGKRLNPFMRRVARISQEADFLTQLNAVLREYPDVYTPIPLRTPDFVCHAVYEHLRKTHQLDPGRFCFFSLADFLPDYSKSVYSGETEASHSASSAEVDLQKPPVAELKKLCEFAYVDPKYDGNWEISPEGEAWRQANPKVSISEYLELPVLTQFLAKLEEQNFRLFADSLGYSGG